MKTKEQIEKSLEHWQMEHAKVASDVLAKSQYMDEVKLIIDALRVELRHYK